ncbi:MAG: sigma factor-like helix-turn-helix DNA-binding protein [Bacillota bacterium]
MRVPSGGRVAGPSQQEAREAGVEPGGLALLYDIYGGLLTPNQRRLFELRYHRDLSLAEIAAGEEVSRQAIHDVLQRSARTLQEAERRLGLAARYRRQRRLVEKALAESSKLLEAAVSGGTPADVEDRARAVHRLLQALRREL